MTSKETRPNKPVNTGSREDRLKAALKANMARRKAQMRARSDAAVEAQDVGAEISGGCAENSPPNTEAETDAGNRPADKD